MASTKLQKMMARWAEPTRPVLLPKMSILGNITEARAVSNWNKFNINLLLNLADELEILSQTRWAVECDALFHGINQDHCRQLVKEITEKWMGTKNMY